RSRAQSPPPGAGLWSPRRRPPRLSPRGGTPETPAIRGSTRACDPEVDRASRCPRSPATTRARAGRALRTRSRHPLLGLDHRRPGGTGTRREVREVELLRPVGDLAEPECRLKQRVAELFRNRRRCQFRPIRAPPPPPMRTPR